MTEAIFWTAVWLIGGAVSSWILFIVGWLIFVAGAAKDLISSPSYLWVAGFIIWFIDLIWVVIWIIQALNHGHDIAILLGQ